MRCPVSVLLAFMIVACGTPGPIAEVRGAWRVDGPLALRAITFATDDYYFRPSTTEAEEGWLEVSENRTRPDGRRIRLHFIRFRSTSQQPGPPVVYLAGGPGGSGILSAAGDRYPLFMAMRAAGDVIALDPRGGGLSDPAPRCPGTWSYPLNRPLEVAVERARLAPYLGDCAAHWADSVDVGSYTTVEGTADLEDLRTALGSDRLSLWGISSGTQLALAYLHRYPDRVHRAVLAGVEAPWQTYKSPAGVDAVLGRLDSAIAADRRASRVVRLIPALRAALDDLEGGRTVDVEYRGRRARVTVGPADLQRAMFFAFHERADLERVLERLVPMIRGDYTALGVFALRSREDNGELVMALSTDCAAGVGAARAAAIEAEAARAVLGDAGNLDLRTRCPSWSAGDLGDQYRTPFRSSAAVLFVSGTLDARTPPENVAELLPWFPNGHHLVIAGAAHDDDLFLSARSLRAVMSRFLATGEVGRDHITLGPLRFRLP